MVDAMSLPDGVGKDEALSLMPSLPVCFPKKSNICLPGLSEPGPVQRLSLLTLSQNPLGEK